MGSNPSDKDYGMGDNNPVNEVSWYDAVNFWALPAIVCLRRLCT